MDKYQAATKYYNAFIKLSDPKKNEISRLCNKLLNVNYLCKQKKSDNKDYYLMINYLNILKPYFYLMDYELNFYESDNVLGLSSLQGYNHKNLKKVETIILLILRKLYYLKMQEISLLDDIVVSVEQIHDEINITNISNRRLTKNEFKEAISTLKRFNIVDNIGNLDQDESIIIIYPTIIYVLNVSDIEQINNLINELKGKGDFIEKVSEDQAD